jgi:ubiquinone/menaquinone biosynthesis C-methylase UbiE
MDVSYGLAFREIAVALAGGGRCLDCGADDGSSFETINKSTQLDKSRYYGVEWNGESVLQAQRKGLNVVQGDLNRALPFSDGYFRCVLGLSSLEHLLNGCAFMKECHRVLEKAGKLILLTPNISSGPHPDSNALLAKEELFKVSSDSIIQDTELERPVHRHLVVFSYRALRQYLVMIGFSHVQGYGFGLYPFPAFMQPVLERIDPYHCHQLVFVATK